MPRIQVNWNRLESAAGNLTEYQQEMYNISHELLGIIENLAMSSSSIRTLQRRVKRNVAPKIVESANKLKQVSNALNTTAALYRATEESLLYGNGIKRAVLKRNGFAQVTSAHGLSGLALTAWVSGLNDGDRGLIFPNVNIAGYINDQISNFLNLNDTDNKKNKEFIGISKNYTLYENENSYTAEASYETDGFNASGKVEANKLKASGKLSATMYSYDKDGNIFLDPKLAAELGVSYTLASATGTVNFGNEYLGGYAQGNVVVGQVAAEAGLSFSLLDDNHNLNPQLTGKVGAKAVAVEVSGKAGVNIGGVKMGVAGSVGIGAGADASITLQNGVLKVDASAYLGFGGSVSAEIDVSGALKAISDIADTVSQTSDAISNTVEAVSNTVESISNTVESISNTVESVSNTVDTIAQSAGKVFRGWAESIFS